MHWKLRAVAIVAIVAALLTGTIGLMNTPDKSFELAPAFNRLVALLNGGTPTGAEAQQENANDSAVWEAAAVSSGAPTASDAPDGAAATPTDAPTDAPTDEPTHPAEAATPAPVAPIMAEDVHIAISGSDDDPDNALDNHIAAISPNQRIPKDFHVENRGTADVCVFMTLTVPYVTVATQEDDGTWVPPSTRPLYRFETNPGWELLESRVSGDAATYVYAWASGDGAGDMTPLAPGQSTSKLFDALITVNYVEGTVDGVSGNVVAEAHALQAANLGQARTPAEIWALVENGELQ